MSKILTLAFLIAATITCAPAASAPKVVLVIADYVSLSDLMENAPPVISKLVAGGGIGLLIRGGGISKTTTSAYAMVGAGSYGWANEEIDEAYMNSEPVENEIGPAEAVFKRRTGKSGNPAVVHLQFPQLEAENEDRLGTSAVGALGEALARSGKTAAVFGNSDLPEGKRRRAVAIAASAAGSVPLGDVSQATLRREPFSPTGMVTNSPKLASKVDETLMSADFVVVDFGDLARVELSKMSLSEEAYHAHRGRALRNLDLLLSRILEGKAKDATLMLAAVSSPLPKLGGSSRLPPILVYSPGGESGCLLSATTRTAGLVSTVDIAPTVLAALDVRKPATMMGSAFGVLREGRDPVHRLDDMVLMNREAIWPVLGILAGLGIASATAASAMIAMGTRSGMAISLIVRGVMLLVLSSPIAMIFAMWGEPSAGSFAVRLAVWMLVISAGALAASAAVRVRLKDRVDRLPGGLPVVILAAATVLTLLVSSCLAGKPLRFTIMNAGQFMGYRFYGIGNEYMGVWLATAFITVVWLREVFPVWQSGGARAVLLAVCAINVLALGLPWFGSNAGGTVAAVIGFGLIYLSGQRGRFSTTDAVLLTLAGFVLVGAIGLVDVALSRGAPSHIGLAASVGERAGYSYLLAVVGRKLIMNLGLLGTTQALWAIIGSAPLLVLWVAFVGGKAGRMVEERPVFRSGMMACLVAAGAAFLFNDSGAVAGGLIFGFVVVAVLYSLLDREA
ncbi:MAG: hypothetical protein HYX78_13540 [Armatimonadetes bacterium]|nr:hypothetical protein [Armatimonadota bacterium]